jgi:hypothetical protein
MFSYITLSPAVAFLAGVWVGLILYGSYHFWEKHDNP